MRWEGATHQWKRESPMRIALVQMFCKWGDPHHNLDQVSHLCRDAVASGAQLALFPELTVTGIYKDERVWELAETLDGTSVRVLRDLARELGLAIGAGFTEKADGKPLNAYCLIEPDGLIAGVYRKIYIPKLEVPFWQGHSDRPVFSVLGQRTGVAICWDNKYPELHEHYRSQGVQLMVMPHAWDSDALDGEGQVIDYSSMEEIVQYHRETGRYTWKTHDQMRDDFYAYIPQLARDGHFYALFVNQSGRPHPSIQFVGPSFVVSPHGEILAETRDGSEQMLIAELTV
jgi:(R)-amidase